MHIVLMSASGGLKKVHREPTEIARYDNVTFAESTSIENPIFIIGGITDIAEFCGKGFADAVVFCGKFFIVRLFSLP